MRTQPSRFAFIIVLLAAAARPAVAADEPGKLAFKGHVRLRAEANERTDFSSNRDYLAFRVRPQFTYTVDPDFKLNVTPQFARLLGEPAYTQSPATGASTRTQLSGNVVDPSLALHEAYGDWKLSPEVSLLAGRQVLSYGDELVIGALDWNNVGRSFDAVRGRFALGVVSSDLLFAKLIDNNTVSSLAGDVDLYALYNSVKLGPDTLATEVYLFYQRDSSGTHPTHLGAFGVRVASKTKPIDYRVEGTRELGNAFTDASHAYQLDAELGFSPALATNPRLALEYFIAGKNYNQLYPTLHKWLGFADVLGRRNVNGVAAHASASPFESVTVRLDFHQFRRTSTDSTAYKLNGVTPLGTTASSSSKDVGSEWDLSIAHVLSPTTTVTGGAALFKTGEFLRASQGDRNPVFYYAQVETKF